MTGSLGVAKVYVGGEQGNGTRGLTLDCCQVGVLEDADDDLMITLIM